jgi:ribosomal protein L29
MKSQLKKDFQSKTAAELEVEAEKRRQEISRLRMEIRMGKIKNTSSAQRKADELAVIKTILQEKRLRNENI